MSGSAGHRARCPHRDALAGFEDIARSAARLWLWWSAAPCCRRAGCPASARETPDVLPELVRHAQIGHHNAASGRGPICDQLGVARLSRRCKAARKAAGASRWQCSHLADHTDKGRVGGGASEGDSFRSTADDAGITRQRHGDPGKATGEAFLIGSDEGPNSSRMPRVPLANYSSAAVRVIGLPVRQIWFWRCQAPG